MGTFGILFALFLVPTAIACLASEKYTVLGLIMFLKWMAFTIPFRRYLDSLNAQYFNVQAATSPFDSPYYFAFIVSAAFLAILFTCFETQAAKLISVVLILSLIFVYFPQAVRLHYPHVMEYANLHTTLAIAEVFGYSRILILWVGLGRNDRIIAKDNTVVRALGDIGGSYRNAFHTKSSVFRKRFNPFTSWVEK